MDRAATSDEHRRELSRRWDGLLQQARARDGFGDFLRAPSLASILPVAADGPIVVINAARTRTDALIVTADGVIPIRLSDLHDGLMHWTNEYLTAIQMQQDATTRYFAARMRFESGDRSPAAFHGYQAAKAELLTVGTETEQKVDATLRWLWDCLAEPVLTALGFNAAVAEPPRVWWCPTGPLTFLPLHAAGHHDDGRSVLDRVVSSYTPTIRALRQSRRRRPQRETDALLIVEAGNVEGQPPLPHTAAEVAALETLFAGRCTVLRGETATRKNVREHLATHARVHFSGHGHQDLARPAEGGLLLSDGTLRIADLSAHRFDGDFAFLSACKSATGGLELEDEVVTLASTLNHTGHAQVIATLWSVYDRSARQVAEGVYGRLVSVDGFTTRGAAHALNATLRKLRAQSPDCPTRWIPFTHTGA
ncbi:CHAT domain-containing protein [Actinomadura sp. KC216]|uniref:CHAT domain-containing protein n=1 Tax=Actinomadura sp. KC216 TaxID=2530370 RepID=UPI00104DC7DB|nr:CHAT domain-containing protein [Actinomadura sp. KC216]TDB84049.1 CHAT domain-containing protein [Actinomadura sp. KC216]